MWNCFCTFSSTAGASGSPNGPLGHPRKGDVHSYCSFYKKSICRKLEKESPK